MSDEMILRLFVNGASHSSRCAIDNIRSICEQELSGHYRLEIIDVMEDPRAARDARILATPTLLRLLPPPLRRVIGDLSNERQVLVGLDILPRRPRDAGSDV